MKLTHILLAGAFAFSVSLQGASTYNLNFNTQSNSPGLIFDGPYAISPYTGTVGGSTVVLYCDDFNDNVYYGQQNITVYSTALPTTTNTTFQDDTRYGVANPTTAGAGYPAGTQLYEEMAWLATQMQNTSGANATYNDKAIQEAIWTLTDDKNVNDGQSPQNQTTTGTGTRSDSGVQQSYLAWIADAGVDYNQSNVTGYANLVSSDWSIVTAVSAAGCTVGSKGSSGCTPGTAGTGDVTQEFLAYSSAPVSQTNFALGNSPEPASFILIGSGLLVGALVGRRRVKAKSNE
jgi:hypothetical protein